MISAGRCPHGAEVCSRRAPSLLRGRTAALWAVLGLSASAAIYCGVAGSPPVAPPSTAPLLVETTTRRPQMDGVAYTFFDDHTGARLGRLRIAQVRLENRRQGFLRVAWRPLIVCEDVAIEITPAADWPQAGHKLMAALGRGHPDGCELRALRLTLPPPLSVEVSAATARLRPDGALELHHAVVTAAAASSAEPASYCFWLTGPRAGRLLPLAPVRPTAPPHATTTALFPLEQ